LTLWRSAVEGGPALVFAVLRLGPIEPGQQSTWKHRAALEVEWRL